MKTPRLISNSGGRTSGLMTLLVVRKGLSPDDYVVFANTGKEREETLEFLHQQELRWGIRIHWIEYCPWNRWKAVSFETASRNGEPFERLIGRRKMVPNKVARFCSQELKIRPMKAFMRSQGYPYWLMEVGIRADEPSRLHSSEKNRERYDVEYPLAEFGITKPDVNAFWALQPFTLALEEHEGNCDLCHLKSQPKKLAIVARDPTRADWWIEMEETTGTRFRREHSYRLLRERATNLLFTASEVYAPDATMTCFCGVD